MLTLDLQFFAKDGPGGEKTEEPTGKKLSDARKEGQVAKSREITNVCGLLGLFLILRFGAGRMGKGFMELFASVYDKIPEFVKMYDGFLPEGNMFTMFRNVLLQMLIMLLPIFIIGFIIAFLTNFIQVKWQVSWKPMQPKFSKMNPINGFKRFFSMNSLVELIKSILKVGLIFYIAYSYLSDKRDMIFLLYDIPLWQAIQLMGDLVWGLGIRICVFYLIIVVMDFAYQKYKFHEDMKMTKQEVKDEMKEQEGDPAVKGKQRAKMQEVSRRRMMQELPKADVVITNPTHYAVAIKYDPEQYDAPYVLAKGSDYLAQKIKEVARENKIEIVENKPLARMLYANVEVGQVVPPELYQTVAEVLAFVYHLQGKV
ncbi:MAG: flagellar biosynthesis protein FlhB [Lachnospiraceae bacterium]|nr:flagellar biosynthesis protein FlhB [Lachnospiraceae bacterium]